MPDRYAVFGHPIGHSKSPLIHTAFARATAQDLRYEAIEAPLDGFSEAVAAFRATGGRGANVTVPFKEQAFHLTQIPTERALEAQAVNTLKFDGEKIIGDNTDGVGLTQDLRGNLDFQISGKRVLLMGAGGAARGVLLPLLQEQPELLVIANRTADKAESMAYRFNSKLDRGIMVRSLKGTSYAQLGETPFDLVINATSASLAGELPPLPDNLFAGDALAYDMMYGRDTPFLAFARAHGVRTADGLGMLVEQAAEAFLLWRGLRPATAPVIAMLRGT